MIFYSIILFQNIIFKFLIFDMMMDIWNRYYLMTGWSSSTDESAVLMHSFGSSSFCSIGEMRCFSFFSWIRSCILLSIFVIDLDGIDKFKATAYRLDLPKEWCRKWAVLLKSSIGVMLFVVKWLIAGYNWFLRLCQVWWI